MESFSDEAKNLSIATLGNEHRDLFIRAISNVLSSQLAEVTYAQIVDGLPLSDVAFDVYHSCVCTGHPLLDEHEELCPGVMEHVRKLSADFDAGTLQMDSRVGAYSLPTYSNIPLMCPSYLYDVALSSFITINRRLLGLVPSTLTSSS